MEHAEKGKDFYGDISGIQSKLEEIESKKKRRRELDRIIAEEKKKERARHMRALLSSDRFQEPPEPEFDKESFLRQLSEADIDKLLETCCEKKPM